MLKVLAAMRRSPSGRGVLSLAALLAGFALDLHAQQRVRVRAEVLVDSSANHLVPSHIVAVGRWIVVGGFDDLMFRVYDASTGRLSASFGREGSGPGEFRMVGSLQVRRVPGEDANSLWAFDPKLGRLSHLRVTARGQLELLASSVAGELAGQEVVLWADDSTLVGAGSFTDARYTLYTAAGRRRESYGTLPYANRNVPAAAAQQILQPSGAVRPGGTTVALGARYASRLELFELRTGRSVLAETPEPFEPIIQIRDNGAIPIFRTDQNTRFGYLSLVATEQHLYALYSGRTRSTHPGRANYGSAIHVFDWRGRLLQILELDRDAIRIARGRYSQELLAIAHHPAPEILRLRVPTP